MVKGCNADRFFHPLYPKYHPAFEASRIYTGGFVLLELWLFARLRVVVVIAFLFLLVYGLPLVVLFADLFVLAFFELSEWLFR